MDANSRAYFRALGKRITERRKQVDMTQAELARALGVSQQTVFAYELGDRRMNVPRLIQLAALFHIPVEELMDLSNVPRPVKRRLSPAGVRHAEQYLQLKKRDQRFVARIIGTLLVQRTAVATS